MRTSGLLLILTFGCVLSADILAVFPHSGKSHFDVFEPLVLALAARGHQLTVLSFFPQRTPVTNVNDISLVGNSQMYVEAITFDMLKGINPMLDFTAVTYIGVQSCEHLLESLQVQNLTHSNSTFDLVLIEAFNTDCFLGIVDKFKAPYVAVSSSSLLPTLYPRLGNFDNFALFPNLFFPFTSRMSYVQRLVNTVSTISMRLLKTYYYSPTEVRAVRKALKGTTDLQKVARNVSLVLVNSHISLQGARQLVPAFVEVGGMHIHDAKPLPKELNQYLNDSPEGVLLFSMGSVLQSSSFPADKRQAFMDAFSELKPLRVLMKWENDSLPGKPDNVRLSRWLPQRDVLAHPKVRAFMGHGGLLSTSEAVYEGVPMVLMPMFGDQPNNVAHLQSTGAAIKLGYEEVTKDNVLRALKAVLLDPSYKEKAKLLSERYRDRPMPPLDTAVYWTEYVIRHKGAPHLRSAAVDMPWYQLWLLDVIAALLASLAVTVYVTVWLTRSAITFIRRKVNPARGKKHGKRD